MSEDVARLTQALARIQRDAPEEFDRIMLAGAKQYLEGPVRVATPKLTGALASATRVVQPKKGGVTFRNTKVYANTLHWGRKTLPRHGRRYPNVVRGTRFITRAIGANRAAFDQHIVKSIADWTGKEITHG